MKREHPDCPCCTCGQIELQWSDRVAYVFLDDHEGVARVVMNCALDHGYDRPKLGVPYGLPNRLTARLAPIVDKHLSAIMPDWDVHDRSVVLDEKQREAFKHELV